MCGGLGGVWRVRWLCGVRCVWVRWCGGLGGVGVRWCGVRWCVG